MLARLFERSPLRALPRLGRMHPQPTILVVDDDPGTTDLVCDYLRAFGLRTLSAGDGAGMRHVLARQPVDLVVLDRQLPDGDGLTHLPALRQRWGVSVIVLTAHASPRDRVLGLENGADDFLAKPFEPRELVARIQSVLRGRRAAALPKASTLAEADVVCFDGWQLHRMARILQSPRGLSVPLSNAEFRLLDALLSRPRAVMTREQALDEARGRASEHLDRSIDLLVSRLRQKMGQDDAAPGPSIRTVRGVGYQLAARQVSRTGPVAQAWH